MSDTVAIDPNAKPAKKEDARPAWLPEKFKTPEELAKSYTELEAKLGAGKPKEETVPPAAEPAKVIDPPPVLDMAALTKEFSEKGALSEKTYTALSGKGIPKAMVDAYIEGQRSVGLKMADEMHKVAGSEQEFAAVAAWATKGVSKETLSAYNDAVNAGRVEVAKLLFAGMKAQFTEAVGRDPSLVSGTVVPSSDGATPFASPSDLAAAFRDPRYKSSPAFRAAVIARAGATPNR